MYISMYELLGMYCMVVHMYNMYVCTVCMYVCMYICMYYCMYVLFVCLYVLFVCIVLCM